MDRQDYLILADLLESVEQIEQRVGRSPNRSYLSSLRKLRTDLASFAGACRQKKLNGRARKRKSGELFRKIIALHGKVWGE